MTIVLGFACKDTLILASDSQMSWREEGFKRWDLPKLTGVAFKNDVYAMVGIAGDVEGANGFRDVFERIAAETKATGPQSIADTAEVALKETRSRFLKYINDRATTPENRQKHLDSLGFAILLGCYWEEKPYLFTSHFYHGRVQRSRLPFETIGCGHDIANFVLAGCDLRSLNFSDALGLAVYAVEKCKKFDDACGGPVQHLMVNDGRKGFPFSFQPSILDVYGNAIEALEKSTPAALIAAISDAVEKAKTQYGKDWIERQKVTPPPPRN